MLPEEHRHQYQEFKGLLGQLSNLMGQENLDKVALFHRSQELQQFFSDGILALDNTQLTSSWGSRLQSYLTEMHKQLRLLAMDINFLQASRNSRTTETRKQVIVDRLQTIIGYCSTLLAESESTSAEHSQEYEKP